MAVDLIGTIGSFKFVVYFTHPERNVPDNLFNPTDSKCGVIQIALDLLKNQFKTANSENKTYHEILTDFLTNDGESKKWIYHPRFEQCASAAVEDLKIGASNLEYTIHHQNNNPDFVAKSSSIQKSHNHESINAYQDFPNKWIRFECVVCKSRWEGYEAGGNQCPKCETSLYSRPIS